MEDSVKEDDGREDYGRGDGRREDAGWEGEGGGMFRLVTSRGNVPPISKYPGSRASKAFGLPISEGFSVPEGTSSLSVPTSSFCSGPGGPGGPG
jgi:hypothetical protein